MSEDPVMNEVKLETPDELTLLKQRADLVGMRYHPNIKVIKMKEKLKAFMKAQNAAEKAEQIHTENETTVDASIVGRPETAAEHRMRQYKQAAKLVRVRVTNMNPNKKDWDGEIFTVSNAVVGTFKKYVPFNANDGWHIPQIILNVMEEKKCQVFQDIKAPNGQKIRKGKLIRELAIEVLPPLTSQELNDMAQQQAMAAGGNFN